MTTETTTETVLPLSSPAGQGFPPDFEWFKQEDGWELGDFIAATPALRRLSLQKGRRIPVYFSSSLTASAFLDATFLQHLSAMPPNEIPPFGDNRWPRTLFRNPGDDNYWIHHKVLFGPLVPMMAPYVDSCSEAVSSISRVLRPAPVAIFQGCLAEHLTEKKRIPIEFFHHAIMAVLREGRQVVLLGNESDKQFWPSDFLHYFYCHSPDLFLNCLGNTTLREALHVLGKCASFVANDTGLVHAAAALGVPGFVAWKDTVYNPTPSRFIHNCRPVRSAPEDYVNAFDTWFREKLV